MGFTTSHMVWEFHKWMTAPGGGEEEPLVREEGLRGEVEVGEVAPAAPAAAPAAERGDLPEKSLVEVGGGGGGKVKGGVSPGGSGLSGVCPVATKGKLGWEAEAVMGAVCPVKRRWKREGVGAGGAGCC